MRSLPLELTNELKKEYNFLRHLVEIQLEGSTLRYTDADLDVYYNNNVYLSRGMSLDAAQFSLSPKIDSISFTIDNVQLEMSSVVGNYEIRGRQCDIYQVALDSYLQVIGAMLVFPGIIDSAEGDNKRYRLEVYSQFIKWNTPTPRRRHITACGWTFKDTVTCRYAGAETTCDKSWDECEARSNTANFGGFRWLADLQDKQIWWGRVPK